MIEIVSATRRSPDAFWAESALGRSLRRLARDTRLVPQVAFENRRGLSAVFNTRLDAGSPADWLVFVHDDVWLDDHFLAERVLDGLARFDIIGVAGNRRRLPGQPAWAFAGAKPQGGFAWDAPEHLSGVVAHGRHPFGALSHFGPVPAACELLDGVFLAARRSRLQAAGVRFDERFDFHFYDLDFCRTARDRGLRLGTWPVALTHQSGGAFGTESWRQGYARYLDKWGESPARLPSAA